MAADHGSALASGPANEGTYQVVARRYRPRGFDELVGQAPVAQALRNAIVSNRVGHAYLFTGARGVGKTSTARIFAKALNCVNGPTVQPDNTCDICRGIDAGEDMDVLEIDGASNRGIEEIRHLRATIHIRPSRARYKIYIIDEVHMLTLAAFNALLKTLEEPPDHVKFIFCTTDPEKIPVTVLSRCQRYDFAPIDSVQIVERLRYIVQQEGRQVEDQVLDELARRAKGSMRDSQSLLEQLLAFGGEQISLNDLHSLLGTADVTAVRRLASALLARRPAEVLAELDAALHAGAEPGHLAEQLLSWFRDMLVAALGAPVSLATMADSAVWGELADQGRQAGSETLLAILQILDQALVRMRQSTYSRLLLEMALLRVSMLPNLLDLAALVESLSVSGGSSSPNAASAEAQPTIRPAASGHAPASVAQAPQEGVSSRQKKSPDSAAPPGVGSDSSPQVPSGSASACNSDPASLPSPPRTPADTLQGGTTSQTTGNGESLEPEVAADALWRQAAQTIGGLFGSMMDSAAEVRWSSPESMVVTFRTDARAAAEQVSRPDKRAQIEKTLESLAKRPVRVQVEHREEGPVTPARPAVSTSPLQAAARDPWVRRAIELFDAEVVRVIGPTPDRSS
ncbi:MAG: DNA polymerase III, subunit gamma and tau [Pirellulaceae bacterium]|nr:MAG: DNA polymerase III, subunit gamma and tau [Pirellulaceae bacterium]